MSTIETNSVKESKNNEIDLIEVLSRIGVGLSRALRTAVIFLIKKSLWLTGFVLFGVGVAVLLYSISQRHYTSTMRRK